MILVHKLKLLFIGIPYSATTAISKDLHKNYGGKAILRKHSLYSEFDEIASKAEKDYYVFAVKRNPMDIVISVYEKMKNDSKGNFTNLNLLEKNGGHISKRQRKHYLFIRKNNASFQEYFKKFYRLPYTSVLSIVKNDCDRIISFENLDDEYNVLLNDLGAVSNHKMPKINQTKGKHDFDYYYTNEIKNQATQVFAPYMKDFGYQMPKGWGGKKIRLHIKLIYRLINYFKKIIYPFRSKIKRKSVENSVYGKIQRSN